MRNLQGKNKGLPHLLVRGNLGLRLLCLYLLVAFSPTIRAQQTFAPALIPSTVEPTLPNSPGSELPSPQSPATATISGTVRDINGGIVLGAKATLESLSGQPERHEDADSIGFFLFKNVPAGNYKIRIAAPDLESYESYEITLHNGENHQLPLIALPIASAKIDVTVTVTEEQLAQEQVNDQLQQRVFGVFPNFYTSFLWNAAPLKPRQKFKLAFRSAIDPVTFFTTGALAGIQQARDTYPDYGQGAEGYGKRYGADYADIFIGRILGAAVFPSVFHQDPRYFYQGTGTISSRAWHAISSAFICRGDNGKRQFNYSHILGNLAAGGISNLYRPDDDRGFGLAIDNALLHTAANAAGNLAREFALKEITTKIPAYAKGKQKPAIEPTKP
jgi:hypothetical protein